MLSEESRRLVEKSAAIPLPDFANLDADGARAYVEALRRSFVLPLPTSGPGAAVSVEELGMDGDAAGTSLRLYRPAARPDESLPVLLFFHGGGWVAGSPRAYDGLSRSLAARARCLVASVAYRLAPEHRWPAASDDALAATRWVSANARGLGADPERISVAGLSAGANLAAVTALRCRDEGGPPLLRQVLVYPVLDAEMELDSHRRNGSGYVTTHDQIAWFWREYAPHAGDRVRPYVSPSRATDLAGLPTALVLAAEYDPLRDEAEAYALALRAAGTEARFVEHRGQLHGFLSLFPDSRAADEALREIAASVGGLHEGSASG